MTRTPLANARFGPDADISSFRTHPGYGFVIVARQRG